MQFPFDSPAVHSLAESSLGFFCQSNQNTSFPLGLLSSGIRNFQVMWANQLPILPELMCSEFCFPTWSVSLSYQLTLKFAVIPFSESIYGRCLVCRRGPGGYLRSIPSHQGSLATVIEIKRKRGKCDSHCRFQEVHSWPQHSLNMTPELFVERHFKWFTTYKT